MPKALHPRDDKDRLYVSRKEGGSGLANNLKITQERAKTNYLWRPTIVEMTNGQTGKQQRLENKNGKKNNYMDTSNDKSKRLLMKKPGCG